MNEKQPKASRQDAPEERTRAPVPGPKTNDPTVPQQRCMACGQTFASRQELDQHAKTAHGKPQAKPEGRPGQQPPNRATEQPVGQREGSRRP